MKIEFFKRVINYDFYPFIHNIMKIEIFRKIETNYDFLPGFLPH